MGNTQMQMSSLRSNITVHSKKGQDFKGKILPQTGGKIENLEILGIAFVILAILLMSAV